MSYSYSQKSQNELEALADDLLARFAYGNDSTPDIEAIVEAFPLRIIPRPGLNKRTMLDAYLPREDGLMFVDADLSADLPIYRLTLAEEISHRILEPELWRSGVPKGANIYELDPNLYDIIEGDAYRLGIAILMPKKWFIDRFNAVRHMLAADGARDLDYLTIDTLANEFVVTYNACVSRCRALGVSQADFQKRELPGAVVF